MAARRLPFSTSAQAWVSTGPLGHLYGGLADCVVLLARYGRARALRRTRARRAPFSS
jgi:hypothetical protein